MIMRWDRLHMAKFDAPASRRGGTAVRCAVYTRKSSEDGLEQDFTAAPASRSRLNANPPTA